jgi:hypothetical protein
MGIVLDSTVLIAAERAGKNPRQVIKDVAARLGDMEATLSVLTRIVPTQSAVSVIEAVPV